MARIQTVKGTVDSGELGVTLVHEHICLAGGFSEIPERFSQKAMEYQVLLTRDAAEVGINTLVDLSPHPDVPKVIELNEKVPQVNLILSTGAYLESRTPPAVRDLSEDAMVEHMTKDLTEGYDGFEDTGVKAGIIKVAAAGPELTEWEKKNFRAAARVQQQWNVPIATHACAGARAQMEVLRQAGGNIAATFYSHVEAEFGWEGRSLEQEARYLEDVTRAGGYLQFNNFDFEFDTPLEDMLYLINCFEDNGCGDRIFLSIDANWTFDEDGRVWHEAEKQHPETGKRTYAYAITHAVPMLMAAGVSLQRINKYLLDNPRRFFQTFDSQTD
jgi:phosphotriesterase-related protein